jgi:hypothetical protein
VLTALEDGVWVRIYEEGGERLLEKQLARDESFTLPADAADPRINTGRPDLLAITVGGKSVPRLAERPTTLAAAPISAAALLARSAPEAVPTPQPRPAATSEATPETTAAAQDEPSVPAAPVSDNEAPAPSARSEGMAG